MKHLLLLLTILFSLNVFSQSVEKVINLPTTSSGSPSRPSLIYYPDDYSSTSTKYPLLVFLHGSGEAGTNLAQIYNSSTSGGPAYLIEHGGWPSSFTNPSDGKAYKFIVVSPQSNNSWSSSGDETENMVKYLVANYRVDVNRIYITGLSAGGGAAVEYAAHLNGDENSLSSVRTYLAAAIVPMSAATITPQQSWADKIVGDNVKTWGLGDPNNDTYGENTMDLINDVNKDKSGYGIWSPNNYGHGGWNNLYTPGFRQTINGASMDIYEWMLSNTRGTATTPPPVVAPPTVSAGGSQTITLPVSSVTLSGSGTAGSGQSISGYSWTKISGPSGGTITTASSAKTTVTGLAAGSYDFRLTVKQSDGQTATSDVVITVNAAVVVAPPTVSAGGSQTITLPVSSVTLSGSGTAGSGQSVSGYSWTKISGPSGGTITTASSAKTTVTGLAAGSYDFRLTVTQNDGQTATSDVVITVNAAVVVAAPTVNAGSGQTIKLPVAVVTLTGTATAASGHTIRSYAWTQTGGPSGLTIQTPAAAITVVNLLVAGTYNFQLKVTQDDGQTATSSVTITVTAANNSAGTGSVSAIYASPTVTVGTNQTLAANSTNLTSSYAINGSTLSSILWTKFSVPGQKKLKIGILGSSTAAGSGPTRYDSAFAGRLLAYYKQAGIVDSVINLAYSGFNPYQAMPTGYSPSYSVYAKLSPSDTPSVNHNITAMLQHKPDVIILCFPSNGFDVLTMAEIMLPLQTIYNICQAQGIPCYVTTSQPRTDDQFSPAKQVFLQVIRDSIMNRFGTHAIDFYDAVTVPGTTQQMPAYYYGDGIHLNDAAHAQLFNLVVGANIFQSLISSSAVINSPSSQNTTISNLPAGISKFQLTVRDAHGQVANAVATLTVNGKTSTALSSSAFSMTDSLLVDNGKGNSFALFPNPVREAVTVTINNDHLGIMNVQVIDPSGVVRQNLRQQKDQSFSQVSVGMHELPAGLYFIRVQIGNWIQTGKLLKL